jgi:hypothetical protein
MSILHITYDYGEPNNPNKTTAVMNLINQTKNITETIVLDLTRTVSFKSEFIKPLSNNHIRINSFGMPLGLTHRFQLERANRKILSAAKEGLINSRNIKLIHAHKLTFEGYIGYLISAGTGCPLFITLRQTDFWVLKSRPDLKRYYIKSIIQSSKIFYLVPFMLQLLKERFGETFYQMHIQDKLVYLPNIIDIQAEPKHTVPPDAPFVTILRMSKSSVKEKKP